MPSTTILWECGATSNRLGPDKGARQPFGSAAVAGVEEAGGLDADLAPPEDRAAARRRALAAAQLLVWRGQAEGRSARGCVIRRRARDEAQVVSADTRRGVTGYRLKVKGHPRTQARTDRHAESPAERRSPYYSRD